MMNIKIILLLSLAAYASCGNNASSKNAASCINLGRHKASSSADPKENTEAEIIEDAFKDCRKLVSIPYTNNHIVDTITAFDFSYYMGDTVKDCDVVLKYIKDHPQSLNEINYIDLKIFGEYFTNHCSNILMLSIKECAKQRRNAAIIKKKKGGVFWEELRRKLKEPDSTD
ncbi:uncharacterized protein LOC126839002 [Adelges cooleyi]|uniref:uncharacterized protein LOC126839002 n=1 Tax=Adelges cooleyi TaxID=133065 RepID=UPI00217F9EEF|nr:uncharacterized protein LOC126839002 [Adelges cooleyi]